jgi:protein involved in polysaccharide export with SLBB domain
VNRHLVRIGFVSPLALIALTTGFAQERSDRSSSDVIAGQLGIHSTAIPLDAPIDPTSYVVGPGDLFNVSISTVPPQVMALTVTAQGNLMIPMVGEIAASGKTLAAFRGDVLQAISKRYLHAAPTISLASPRKVVVRVRGAGVNEGSYVVMASERVQSLLARGDIRRTVARPGTSPGEVERDPVPVLRRSIRIYRGGQDPIIADLDRYEATRSSEWSPYLQEGDEVVFTAATEVRGTVTIGGAVVLAGTVEWRAGDRLADVISFAKGLREDAVPDSVQVLRASGEVEWHTSASETPVLAGDRLVVLSRESKSREALVTIDGEVAHPGAFPIVASFTRLSEVIAMAGGLTAQAMTHAVSIYRSAPDADARRLLLLTSERGNASLEDTVYVRLETQARLYGERVSANLVKAIADPASDENVVLQPGDRIVVPRRTGTVYVFGQVRRPGHQPFKPGAKLSDYLERAGGMTERAKDDEVSVIKYSSRQWLPPDEATVEEGDMIWVPRVVERDTAYQLSIVGQIAGIISAAATLILLVTQAGK